MQQSCKQCGSAFEITDNDLAFYDKVSPIFAGKKEAVPPPTLCPECRQQRRYACRNDRHYYNGACHSCKKATITSYSPDKNIPVLCDSCFWSDKWDPLAYGMPFDFESSFAEQFRVLRETVPRLAIWHTQSENSEYTVHSSRNRNCYMASSLVDDEEVHYSDFTFESRMCMDLFSCSRMELCYECTFCEDCFGVDWCELCTNLSDSLLCFDCKSSSLLVGCVGLRNKKTMILNQPATAKECQETIHAFKTDPAFREKFQKQFFALKLRHPHRYAWMTNAENCTGNFIWNSKNAQDCYNVRHLEDARFIYESHRHTDTMDCSRVANGELLYDCGSIVDLSHSAFCNLTYQCDHLLYCDNCNGTSESFGSVSLKKHKYCILNTQYSKEEYETLVPKIIAHMRETPLRSSGATEGQAGEWGEFFPLAISPFGYNETKAHEWYPLEKEEALTRGWKWSEYEQPVAKDVKTIPGQQLPADIAQIPDDISDWAILCEASDRPFRIIKQELDFYRKRELPVPHRSPKQRYYDRIRAHNIRTLYKRACGKCRRGIETIYAKDRPEIVYCERCYLESVY